jgi:hypothetical protein
MDPLVLENASETLKIGVETGSEFLKAICLPAAQEFGLILKDKLRIWRLQNISPILQDAKAMLEKRGSLDNMKSHPRIAVKVIEEGSLIEDPDLQKMWAGLLASSCTKDGTDETNLIFVNILAQLSSSQAKIINLPFIEGNYARYQHDGSEYTDIKKERSELINYTGLPNWGMLKRELGHLNSLGLINYSLSSNPQRTLIRIHYDEAALRLYARCQGYTGTLQQFLFSITNPSE